ncbi:MAG: MlaD family protein [Bacteroidales bacterium]|nr:MlaD family protein [Bacteroidales bacterium]
MKFNLSKELKAGVIVLLLAAAMYWLVYFLKGRDIFNRYDSYLIEYENVEGISITGPVYIRGLKVGTIKSISYNQSKDVFDVTVQLESKYQIPENSVAQIYSVDLLGTKAIRINVGNSTKMLSHNSLMPSNIAVDLMGYISNELPSLKEQVSGLLVALDVSVQNLGIILGSQNQSNLEEALAYLAETLRYFSSLGAWLNTEVPQIRSIIENLNHLSVALEASSEDIQATMSHLATFTDTLSNTNIAETVRGINGLISQLQNPDGSIGKLLYSDEMHQQLIELLQNLDSLLYNIGQNPKKFFKISVF